MEREFPSDGGKQKEQKKIQKRMLGQKCIPHTHKKAEGPTWPRPRHYG